jgi:hypothetical protein
MITDGRFPSSFHRSPTRSRKPPRAENNPYTRKMNVMMIPALIGERSAADVWPPGFFPPEADPPMADGCFCAAKTAERLSDLP